MEEGFRIRMVFVGLKEGFKIRMVFVWACGRKGRALAGFCWALRKERTDFGKSCVGSSGSRCIITHRKRNAWSESAS